MPNMNKPSRWDLFVAQHPHGHLLQTDPWAALKSDFGWESQLVSLEEDGQLTAGAQVLFRWLPGRLASYAYVPKGPLVNWHDAAQVRTLLERITAAARQRRAFVLQIEPELVEGEAAGWDTALSAAGFVPAGASIQPRRTILVDIRGTEDEILSRMKQKTRYNVRLAGRQEVLVRKGGIKDIPVFEQLMHATGRRNTFGVHSEAYYRAALERFAPSGQVALLLAEFEGRPLAGLMVFALNKTAWYLFGGSNNEERKRMPAYLLQWEAMRWARTRNCDFYDLWGVPDEDEGTLEAHFTDRSDGLWGVYRHKRGYGGRMVRWVSAYRRVLNRPLNFLFGRVTGNR